MAQTSYVKVKHGWGFIREARLRAETWIRPKILQEWYDEIVDEPALGTPTRDPTVFWRYFAASWSTRRFGFRFWYKSPYKSPRTREEWKGMIVLVEVVHGDNRPSQTEERQILVLIIKLVEALTEGLKLGRVIVERIPKGL